MSMQLQSTSTVLSVSLEKNELLRAIKNEPPESEIGIDDIPNSLDEESIPDLKDVDIVSHILTEDLIKSETVSENTFENNHSGSVETQVSVETENIPLIKTENITQSEYLYKTQNSSDGNGSRGTSQGVIEVQDSNEHFNALQIHKTVETSSCKKDRKKGKVVEVPVIPIEPHKYTSLAKAKHACNKNKSMRKQNKKRYSCKKCTFISENHSYLKLHQLTHKRKAEMDDRFLKYRCNKCKYKTYWYGALKNHKLTHLKPEEIHYFYCYHCSYKSKLKAGLQTHIFRHFKNEDVPFHCYICDFTTLKRNLIIEHFKKHPKHHTKCDETEVDGLYLKYRCDKCKYKTCWPPNLEVHKLIHLKPEEIQYFYCYHCSYKCKQKINLQTHIFRHFKNENIPFHCYICDFVTLKRDLIIEHFKTHPKHHSKCDKIDYETYTKKQMRHCCEKCTYTSEKYYAFKRHQLTHKTKAEIDDRLLKYRCDKCKFKTCWWNSLKWHKLTHLKSEEIHYFYCHHCSCKCKHKSSLQTHISRHFQNEDVPFHCYICDFTTLKRNLIIEHFKKHPKHHSKCDEIDYKNQLEIPYFYCYHCSHKSKLKSNLKTHIFRHFKREEIPFHCYICNFVTLKRDLIIEHFKKHPKHHSKCDETYYKYQLETYTKNKLGKVT